MLVKSQLKVGSPIMLVAEAPGQAEDATGLPFQGASGDLLNSMLAAAGIDRSSCSIANVFQQRPPGNNIMHFFGGKREYAKDNPWPPFQGKYLKTDFFDAPGRLRDELARVGPRVVVCLGATALWALTGNSKITDHRGTLIRDERADIIPTFHPAAVLRDYGLRPIVIGDLDRARRHTVQPLQETVREIFVPESRADLERMFARLASAKMIAADVETEAQQITCISLAPTPQACYVVPIWAKHEPGWSAWSLDTEAYIYQGLRDLAWRVPLLFHNAVYDLTYLREYGILPRLTPHDTMLLWHAAQPELKKSLGFVASMVLDQPSWKWMRTKSLKDVTKKDE